jgi:hypothetical protein
MNVYVVLANAQCLRPGGVGSDLPDYYMIHLGRARRPV